MEYRIAIPSYQRSETVKTKTLDYILNTCGVSPSIVDVFVANEKEYEDYKYLKDLNINIIIGKETLRRQRNFIDTYYPEGARIFCLDDDVEEIVQKKGNKTVTLKDLDTLIQIGFNECRKHKTKLFGIGAVTNHFFMNNKISTNLKYIVGCTFGQIITHNKLLQVTLEDKEDFERTIRYFDVYKKVVRLNMFAPKTAYYTEEGGMQVTRTEERVSKSAHYLIKKYPEYCSLNTAKKSSHVEIKLNNRAV